MKVTAWSNVLSSAAARFVPAALLLLSACATQPPAPDAQPGTVAFAQQSYNQKLQQCQEAHLNDAAPDAGIGATQTSSDSAFSGCMAQANKELDLQMGQSLSQDAGSAVQ
jgi:outer membrane biogenesis lipoprotein LolB